MSSAWKDLERRVCRALGAQRKPSIGAHGYASGSDDDGTAPFSVEVKRSKRKVPEGRWIRQAKANGKADGRPWLLVVAGHYDSKPIAVLDFWTLVQLAQEAGRLPELSIEGGSTMLHETPQPTEPEPQEPEPETPEEG
jgi:hypothetical protein